MKLVCIFRPWANAKANYNWQFYHNKNHVEDKFNQLQILKRFNIIYCVPSLNVYCNTLPKTTNSWTSLAIRWLHYSISFISKVEVSIKPGLLLSIFKHKSSFVIYIFQNLALVKPRLTMMKIAVVKINLVTKSSRRTMHKILFPSIQLLYSANVGQIFYTTQLFLAFDKIFSTTNANQCHVI